MSSGQGENVLAKADGDTETQSSNEADIPASKDRVDHFSDPSLDKDAEGFQDLITEDTSNKTDSGFKDNLLSDVIDKTKSISDNTDENSDDDIELKWEDDETDEQNATPFENVQEASEQVSEDVKPMEADVNDSKIYSTDDIDGKNEDVDENKLLQSSPSNNEDSNLSSSNSAKTDLLHNKINGNEAISENVDDIMDENQLLKSPESYVVDRENFKEITDKSIEDSLLNDDITETNLNSTKTVPEKSENVTSLEKSEDSSLWTASKIDIEKETAKAENIATLQTLGSVTKLVSGENISKLISDLKSTSPTLSQIVLSPSPLNDSPIDTTLKINTEHGLNKPDVMLEIPTQEIIELMDDTDISISINENDEEMEVDDANDSPNNAPVVDIIEAKELEEPTYKEKATAIILKPADVFRALDTQKQIEKSSHECNKTEDVSEDDWCEIERRLEGFEDSVNETSHLNENSMTEEPENVKETQPKYDLPSAIKSNDKDESEKAEGTGTSPLSEAQKSEKDLGYKKLLKTLLDTSKLDSTELNISTTMEVDEQTLLNQSAIESSLKSTQNSDKDDNAPKTDKKSHLDEPKEATLPTNKKEMGGTSDSEIKKLISMTPLNKTDIDDSKPKSASKSIEHMEVQVELTNEHLQTLKPETEVSTTDSSLLVKEKTPEPIESMEGDESTKLKDHLFFVSERTKSVPVTKSDDEVLSSTNIVDIPIEAKSPSKPSVEDENDAETFKSTIEDDKQTEKDLCFVSEQTRPVPATKSDNEVLTSTLVDKPIQVKSPSKIIEDENNAETSIVSIENSITLKPKDKIENQLAEILIDDVKPSTSKLPCGNEIVPSTVDNSLSDSNIGDDKKVTSIGTEPNKEITSTMEVEPSTCEVQPSTLVDDVPSSSIQDSEVPSTLKTDDIKVQPSTSKAFVDIQPSTSTEVPLTSVEPDPDSADDVPETSDSLGLLAESSRVMEDDEEQDDDDDADGDGDEDDDYDPEDESSNQMTAEHSEDSNAQDGKETDLESPMEEKGEEEFSFAINDGTEKKDGAIGEEKDGGMDVDEEIIQDDIEVTPEQIGNEVTTDAVESTDTTAKSKEGVTDNDKPKQADIETVKLSEKSKQETEAESMLRKLLVNDDKIDKTSESQPSPNKKLGFSQPLHVMNIVDLEESSSEDDIQEVKKEGSKDGTLIAFEGYKITIPSSVDVTTVPVKKVAEKASEKTAVTDDKDKETPDKVESNVNSQSEDKSKPKFSLEVFSLDSDEEDNASASVIDKKEAVETGKTREPNKCINISCTSTGKLTYYNADAAAIAYYDAAKRKKALVCQDCAEIVVARAERLVNGIKDLTPLLDLDTCKLSSELVEISDSESEDEGDTSDEPKETLGDSGASFVESNLAKMINDTWIKFCLDSRLNAAQDDLNREMEKLEAESKEIDVMLSECQIATDKLRNDLYATFEQQRREVNAIVIYDTPVSKYSFMEKDQTPPEIPPETRAKRRMSSATEIPAKRPAIPMGYTPLDSDTAQVQDNKSMPIVENTKAEDDKDISVLKVSAEAAPSDLPPPGELVRPPLRAGQCVYAMRNAFGCWIRSRILEVNGKSAVLGMTQTFTVCRVKYEHKPKGQAKLSPARCLAYAEPSTVRLTIGTRVIALFKDSQNPLKKDAFYSGIISEVPNPVNNYRYLVFFDDGYAQYVQHRDTRIVCECSPLVWEEVHPFSREFVREYLLAYPERPMVRLHAGQSLKTEWNGKWWASRVIQVDASLVQVHFEQDNRTEWIYRGSTRLAPLFLELQAAERHRARPMPRTKAQPRINMPYVEYTRWDEQSKSEQPEVPAPPISDREIRQRAVAKKSTALPPTPNIPAPSVDSVTSRVVYYTPKNAVKPYKMTPHNCGPHCKRKDVLALKDLRTYNPLAKPLLSGWERQIVRYKGHKEVMYRAPCGRRLRSLRELHRYLRLVHADMPVDLFDFTPHTHCLAEFVLNKCLVGKKDLSHGKENVPVPCVNYYDESLPEFCSYNTERTPTAGVPLNLDPEFLCGCDCTDDCEDKSKCACWQMTLEGARTIGLGGPDVGYRYKRLPEPMPSGIYECNSRCKCKHTCLNRVAQHPLQLKLQVFKTLNRGWGIRALNDIPKGSFLCVYAGNLLTDATANMDGLNEGDEYLAELDYIEVVEQMKEGYEEDIPVSAKRLDKKNATNASEESDSSSSEEEEETPSKDEQEDGDFCPGYADVGMGVSEFSKRLRKREKNKKKMKQEGNGKEKVKDGEKTGEDCITISDDEEVREPSRFMAQAGMGKEFISKYRSVRTYFGKDEACYIMDAKVQGNIGRYLNHSCQPNVFVQNVFVDTHDPRFPWVAFFALSHIKAGTELTWNYNYDVGSVPGKVLYCYCGAPNCRGRLL